MSVVLPEREELQHQVGIVLVLLLLHLALLVGHGPGRDLRMPQAAAVRLLRFLHFAIGEVRAEDVVLVGRERLRAGELAILGIVVELPLLHLQRVAAGAVELVQHLPPFDDRPFCRGSGLIDVLPGRRLGHQAQHEGHDRLRSRPASSGNCGIRSRSL